MCGVSFLGPSFASLPMRVAPSVLLKCRQRGNQSIISQPVAKATLSEPFPLPDLFSFPTIIFTGSPMYYDYRPELVGACLWTLGLYLGFSQHQRYGAAVQRWLRAAMSGVLSNEIADLAADFLHSLPFLIAGFGIDAVLRYLQGGNAVWALASGLSVAMYGGIYELARQSVRAKKVSEEDMDNFDQFQTFSERMLADRGRCHLIDIRNAARRDPRARHLGYLSDETLRRYIRTRFPQAVRSPNGYYRGLSVRGSGASKRDTTKVSSSGSSKQL